MAEKEPKLCINGCGKTVKNQGVHDRYCPKLPHDKPAETPELPPLEQPPLIISDVQPYKQQSDIYDAGQVVAWFTNGTDRMCKEPSYIGILHTEKNDCIPCVLMIARDGTLIPPFMMDGFIGMLPQNYEWNEEEQQPETQPPIEQQQEPEHIEATVEKPRIIVPPAAKEPQKRTLLSKLFHKEPKPDKKLDALETIKLMDEAINVSKGI